MASIFASVFSPTELFYTRANADVIDPQLVMAEVPWIASPELAKTEWTGEELKDLADRISREVAPDEPTSTLRNLVWSESRWDVTAEKNGDRGLAQINRHYHLEVSDAEAFDPTFALTYAARSIARGTESQFTVCNCYAYLKTRLGSIPLMADITPNTTPKIGAVAIFLYRDKQTLQWVKHVALIEKLSTTGFTVAETNFTKCLFDRREIAWGDVRLQGFWSAPSTGSGHVYP